VGLVAALRADCFYPTDLSVTDDPEYTPLEGNYFVNPAFSPMFGFFEKLDQQVDIDACVASGGFPASKVEVKVLPIPIVTNGDAETTEDEETELVLEAA
jgi:hypothetical protein